MMALGPLAFAAPLALAGFAVLPVIWWLLRLTPPLPRRQSFPPVRLLLGLQASTPESVHTPWWLLALRLLMVALVLLGLAQPIISPNGTTVAGRPLLLVVDDGWSAAPGWSQRQQALLATLDQADRQQRPLALLTTAPPADGTALSVRLFDTANAAREAIRQLIPQPWDSDHRAALAAVRTALADRTSALQAADAVWFSGGLATPGPDDSLALAEALQRLGSLTVRAPAADQLATDLLLPLLTLPPQRQADGMRVMVRRPASSTAPLATVTVEAVDDHGLGLGSAPLTFAAGADTGEATLALPTDLLAGLQAIRVTTSDGQRAGAGAVSLLGDGWRHHPVGLLTPPGQGQAMVPLLDSTTYITRALPPNAPLYKGGLDELLARPIRALIVVDPQLSPTEQEHLSRWVQDGGVLIRFAGAALAGQSPSVSAGDSLLAVPVRSGNRALGGSLSWTKPLGLAAYPEHSPLQGLPLPKDLTVRAQVLPDPAAAIAKGVDLDRRTWARLSDGTPLVSGTASGKGWLVLVHTAADPSWSSLPLSGLFPALLNRLVSLGAARSGEASNDGSPLVLPPALTLDGTGRLLPAPATARPLHLAADTAALPMVQAPDHPPGLYGADGQRQALNLGTADRTLIPLPALPSGVQVRGLTPYQDRSLDLRPPLLAAALLLLLLDSLVTLVLRGLLPRWRTVAVMMLTAGSLLTGAPSAEAAETDLLATRLGYVQTGDPAQDAISAAALQALTALVNARTAVTLAPPVAVSLDSDPLLFFPLLYWPVRDGSAALRVTPTVVQNIARYRSQGGLVVLDGAGTDSQPFLVELLDALHISGLIPLPADHVLTRAYYLSAALPGRAPGSVWLESPDQRADGVSTIVVSTQDWGRAWARSPDGSPMFPMLSGGEHGREQAGRSGINMVLYTLTGTYKADQIHLPALLERLPQ